VTGTLGNVLNQLSKTVEGLLNSADDVLAGTLFAVKGSLSGVSGALCGVLSGISGALSGLGSGLVGGVASVIKDAVEPAGNLTQLLDGLATNVLAAITDALLVVATNAAQILRVLSAVLSSLGGVNNCGN